MPHAAIVLLASTLIALVAGNNLSACSGAIISSRVTSRRAGILITIIGYSLGLGLQGRTLQAGFLALMPNRSDVLVLIALATAIVIFVVAHLTRVPQSLSLTLACAILGISTATHGAISEPFVLTMLAFWVFAPVVSVLLIVGSMQCSRQLINERSVWGTIRGIKGLLVALSFLAAFTLGANTIGFVYAAMPRTWYDLVIAVLAITAGSILLSAGEIRRVGNEILPMRYINSINSQLSSVVLVELATLFSVPLSNTQTFTMGVYGAGLSYKYRLLIGKSAKIILSSWLGMVIISFLLGYMMADVLVVHSFI
ncbi:MAG TPA: inorganic phosphate transporter [bacterium]|nr:inorganic phosphate transporter [bacterium]